MIPPEHVSRIELDPIVPTEVLIILLIVGAIIFIWDLLDRRNTRLSKRSGLDRKTKVVALSGSSELPLRELYSNEIGLSGRPGGLLRDGEDLIPVEYSPLTKKVQDRHVIQLVIHMRLLEVVEGKKPPYGLLVLGPDARSVKIKNTQEKQDWLDRILREMREIVDGAPAKPAPSYYKCRSCDVHEICAASLYRRKEDQSGSAAVDGPEDLDRED